MVHRLRRVEADLERVELATQGVASKWSIGAGRDPPVRQVRGHLDGEAAVLGEQQVGRLRMATASSARVSAPVAITSIG